MQVWKKSDRKTNFAENCKVFVKRIGYLENRARALVTYSERSEPIKFQNEWG